MRHTFRSRLKTIDILSWSERRPFETCIEFSDRVVARAFLRELFEDRSSAHSLRRFLIDTRPGVCRLGEHELVELLAWRLVRGEIKVAMGGREPAADGRPTGTTSPVRDPLEELDSTGETTGAHGSGSSSGAAASGTGLASTPTGVSATHWIRFHLVDDDTGEPLSDIDVTVKLPTGDVETFRSDADGFVRVDGLPAGNCGIGSLTGADALEVVSVA